jgi:hypothetical protein
MLKKWNIFNNKFVLLTSGLDNELALWRCTLKVGWNLGVELKVWNGGKILGNASMLSIFILKKLFPI